MHKYNKFVNNNFLNFYLNKIFDFALYCRTETSNSFAKLKYLFCKANTGQKTLSYIRPSLWNNLPEPIKKPLSNIM